MKKIKTLSIVILIVSNFVFANSQSLNKGLYLTYQDFIGHHLSYNDCSKIILNRFAASTNIKVVTKDGKVIRLKKSSVFGYADSKGQSFRFYNNELYKIIDNSNLMVYSFYSSSNEEKGKGSIKKEVYFFSLNSSSELIPLTVSNIKKKFPSNLRLHDLLSEVKSNEELASYREYAHCLYVNYLLQKSIENQLPSN